MTDTPIYIVMIFILFCIVYIQETRRAHDLREQIKNEGIANKLVSTLREQEERMYNYRLEHKEKLNEMFKRTAEYRNECLIECGCHKIKLK